MSFSVSFSAHGIPVLLTLFIWWFSTGIILYLDGLPKRTYRWSFLGTSIVAVMAFAGLIATRDITSITAAYIAFSCSILIWGWQEMAFLMGYITGTRDAPCPANAAESQRFMFATQAIIYHELALIATGLVVVAFTWESANQVGAFTYFILWAMRLSAKLNLFLGVRNLYEKFLPDHLKHLESYFKKSTMNLLFPVSVTAASIVAAMLWNNAISNTNAFDITRDTLLATLLTLAVIEHWFLVLPVPAEAMWNWALGGRAAKNIDSSKKTSTPTTLARSATR
jgi:putative photosynthetic complex assembly protein 2